MIIKTIAHICHAWHKACHFTHTISLNENHKGIWWMLKKKYHLFYKGGILLNQRPAFRGSKTHLTSTNSCAKSLANKVN